MLGEPERQGSSQRGRPGDLHGRNGETPRRVRHFTAAVFVTTFASAGFLLLHLGQSTLVAVAFGLLVGAWMAVEIGWFGGRVFFGEDA